MRWRRVIALAIVVIFLGMTVSTASVEARIIVQGPQGERSKGVVLNPSTPGNQSRTENVGAIGELAPRIFSIEIPVVGEVILIAQLAEILVKIAQYVSRHTYGKPVAEFTKGFIEEIPAKHNGYTQVTKMNFWGTKVEIGYGYVKSEWWGLRKETVIVEHVITVNRDDVTAVGDLFSPEEYGKLLAMAWLSGWDANDAKKLAEEFDKKYKNFYAFYSGGYHPSCEAGPVIIKQYGARHIIKRHITQEIPGGTPWEVNSARELLDIIKQVIENPDIEECKPWKDTHRAVLHKSINGKWYTVVIERVRYWWEVVTAFPRDTPPV